jgi:hypothetical protein
LQNHSTYKIYCKKLQTLIHENTQLKYIPYEDSYVSIIDIYIEIVPRQSNSNGTIYMNIWKNNQLHFGYYSMDSRFWHRAVKYSEFFKKYPTLSTRINYNRHDPHICQQEEEIIELLEKFQILHPEYRDKQFNIIMQKCVQIIMFIRNFLYDDLMGLVIYLLLKLLPHGDDFIWHHQQKLKN